MPNGAAESKASPPGMRRQSPHRCTSLVASWARFFDRTMDERLQQSRAATPQGRRARRAGRFRHGYSALPFARARTRAIKIDRSFVTKMLDKAEEANIVKAIVNLGRALRLNTTAEGIETDEALELLAHFGCNAGQGDLFGMPVSAARRPKLFTRRSRLWARQGAGSPSAAPGSSPSADPRAAARILPWRWSRCPASRARAAARRAPDAPSRGP